MFDELTCQILFIGSITFAIVVYVLLQMSKLDTTREVKCELCEDAIIITSSETDFEIICPRCADESEIDF